VQTALARTHLAWNRLHARGNAEAYTRKIMYNEQVSKWRRHGGGRGGDDRGRLSLARLGFWAATGGQDADAEPDHVGAGNHWSRRTRCRWRSTFPGWSSDSGSIVYTAAGGPIDGPLTTIGPTMRVPATSGEPVKLWDSSLAYPVWSADGKHLGFLNGTGGAGVLDVQHGTMSDGPDLTNFGKPRYLGGISPDGSPRAARWLPNPANRRASCEPR
jgi:hypothetical protein